MSELFQNILFIQNKLLLEMIAEKKFTNDKDKKQFIHRYHKLNYHRVDIVRDPKLFNSYKKRTSILLKQ